MTGVSRQLPNFFASFCLASAIEETSAYRAGPAMLEGTTEPLPDALLPFSAPISHDVSEYADRISLVCEHHSRCSNSHEPHFSGISGTADEFTELNEPADSENCDALKRRVRAGLGDCKDPAEP
jgi:hypothetical protein